MKTYQELENFISSNRRNDIKTLALLPVGCIEQHGPFLPLDTDSLIADGIAKDICINLINKKYSGFVFPVVHYTPTKTNSNYTGTVSVPDEIFRNYIRSLCEEILESSFDALVLISGHGGADHSLKEINFWQVNNQYATGNKTIKPVLTISIYECSLQLEKKFKQKPGKHADWRELLMIYKLLGDSYFNSTLVESIKEFARNNCFDNLQSRVYGIPLELRSTMGVIGEVIPEGECDWKTLADDMWDCMLDNALSIIASELDAFWSRWAYNPYLKANKLI